MNKKNILDILKRFSIQEIELKEDLDVNDLSTNLNGATSNQIVFYRIREGENAKKLFLERYDPKFVGLLVVTRKLSQLKGNYIVVNEDDFLALQKYFLDALFPLKKDLIKLVGVTGTNGKTSVVSLAMQIAKLGGYKAVSVGTVGIKCSDEKSCSVKIIGTTPSYVELRKIIYELQDNYDVCFFEFSSHALAQDRLHDIRLDVAGWTNFTQDHLDYHGNMDEYFKAKLKIGKKYLKEGKSLIIAREQEDLNNKITKSGVETVLAAPLKLDDSNVFFKVDFNKSNLELAMSLTKMLYGDRVLGIDFSKIELPKGRFEIVSLNAESFAIVDYAHTPDALENLLSAVKKSFPEYFLRVLFGCGGDRDKSKRPLMGKAASKYADYLCVTSDNPRSEDPTEIINDIRAGIEGDYEIEPDRQMAIMNTLKKVVEREIVVIAGKGHEEYQEINGIKKKFSDFEVIERFKNDKIR